MPVDPSIIAGGLRLAGTLFGKKSKAPTPSEMVIGAAEGARRGAELYGFNPLTLLSAAGTNAAAGGGGQPAPLASLSILADIVDEKYGQDAKDRREHNRLQNELLALEVDRARTLNTVAVAPGPTAGGALTGGRVASIVAGPANGFLTEKDRNPAVADERDTTVSFQSHGQQSVIAVGPDWDEMMTGWLIDANNRRKARLAEEAAKPPRGIVPAATPDELAKGRAFLRGVGTPPNVYNPEKSLGPKGWKKPKPNPNRRDLPQKRWEQTFRLN